MSCLDLWVAAFDRLSEAIEGWDPCCDGVGAPPAGTEDVVTYDDTDIIADNTDVEGETHPSGFPTLNDFREHQCGLAHQFAGSTDALVDRIEGLATTAQNVVVFATLVVLAYANVIGMAVAAILAGGYAMVTASEIFGAASAFSELRDLLHRGDPFGADEAKIALSARYDDIVEAIYCANDATEAAANLRAILDAELSGPLLVLAKLMWSTPMLRLAFEFQGTVTPATNCDCDISFDFVHDATFEVDYDGWTGGNLNRDNTSCAGWSAGLGGLNIQLRARDAATQAGYTYNEPAEFYLKRIEADLCVLETGLRISLNYRDIADEDHDYPSGPKTITLDPPNSDEPVANNLSQAKDIVISQTEAGGGARFTGIRTYWTVVEV